MQHESKITFAARMALKNDLILRAAQGITVERPPVWLMRQAGRVLPEYRATRARAGSFLNLLKNAELASEVTVQPVDILHVDAAILFSDILVIPEAMGLPYLMDEGKGPVFPQTVRDSAAVQNLTTDVAESLQYVMATIRQTKERLNDRVPLIGFAGAPWTVFCYMTEGKGSKTFSTPRGMIHGNPELAKALLEKITDATCTYLDLQIANGCNMVQLFDSWAGILGPDTYAEFSLPYLRKICEHVRTVPVTVFALGASFAMDAFAELPCATIGIDWHTSPQFARKTVGPNKTLQGNLDPAVLYGSHSHVQQKTREMLMNFGTQRYIANLGHGLYPDIDPKKVITFVETLHNFDDL